MVGDVALHQFRIEYGIGVAELQRVEHDDSMPSGAQLSHSVRADVASTSGDEHVHGREVYVQRVTPARVVRFTTMRDVTTSADTRPFVRVIVINYDGGDVTRRCVDALLATNYPADRLQIVVVDNASVDGLNWVLREEYPNVMLIESNVNEGFARGCNLAMRNLDGIDFVALINNDAIVPTDWLEPLLGAFRDDKVGAVVPKLLLNVHAHALYVDPERVAPLADGRMVGALVGRISVAGLGVDREVRFDERFFPAETDGSLWSKGHASVWWPVAADAPASEVAVEIATAEPMRVRVGGRGRQLDIEASIEPSTVTCTIDQPLRIINSAGGGLYKGWFGGDRGFLEPDIGQYDEPCEVFSWCGGAVVLRADYLRDAGIFDTSYFLYYEDFDLAWRGRQLGWTYWYEPTVEVLHEHAYSSKAGSDFFNFWVDRNRRLTLLKNAPRWVAIRAFLGFYPAPVRIVARHVIARLRQMRPPSPTVLKRQWTTVASFSSAVPGVLKARRELRRRRTVGDAEIMKWTLTK